MSILKKIFGDNSQKFVKKLQPIVQKINELEHKFEPFSNEELLFKSMELKKRIALKGVTELDAVLAEAFALVREAAKRTLGQRHYDVQLIGGIVLHEGKIAEMRTGEGKTLASTLPVYLNALSGKGVHIITVNDYLARRDTVWMGQIYNALGLTVGCINHDASYVYDPLHTENQKSEIRDQKKIQDPQSQKIANLDLHASSLDRERDMLGSFKVVHEYLRPVTKKEAYAADITYGTNNEFGFDYLRDNMAYHKDQLVQRGHAYAIIDEVDSILIDEARTPLIISAPDEESPQLYALFARIVPQLQEGADYTVDEKLKAVSLTEAGIEKVEHALKIDNLYGEEGTRYVHYLDQSLRAKALFFKDKDYVVKDGEVIIVDEFTGRLMPGRRWSQGLHQAIEAREGVPVQKESKTLATITFQNYFKIYEKIAGMTGTALTSVEEFHKVYRMEVAVVPTHKPIIRHDFNDKIFKTSQGKWRAVVREIKRLHEKGQPILVGTVSIERNELLSSFLKREGLSHEILNAKNHEREAEIIAQAGKWRAITIATNMAGRGVDIVLGGNPPDTEQAQKVRECGGLHVIGTERHEARRIDNQLRGRAGRQGDAGSSQFFVSLEDDVVRIFGGDRIKGLMDRLGIDEDQPIENKFITRAIEQAQGKVEGHNFDARKYVLEFDNVMNRHRETIYALRKKALGSETIREQITEFIENQFSRVIAMHTQGESFHWDMDAIVATVQTATGTKDNVGEMLLQAQKLGREGLKKKVFEIARKSYKQKEETVGTEQMRQVEKYLLLQVIDQLWIEHLEAMDYLRQSVNLRAYGQRDPLVEYRTEGHRMFKILMENVQAQVAGLIFRVQPRTEQKNVFEKENIRYGDGRQASQPSRAASQAGKKVGRNDPCPCGSGKKYKRCHGA